MPIITGFPEYFLNLHSDNYSQDIYKRCLQGPERKSIHKSYESQVRSEEPAKKGGCLLFGIHRGW